ALVGDRLVVGATGLEPGATLDGPVDVVVGDRGLLRLLDGVVERRVAGRVTAARASRDLDVLDQLGEELAALGVDAGLLVLRRRPLGMPAHAAPPPSSVPVAPARLARSARTRSTNSAWTR